MDFDEEIRLAEKKLNEAIKQKMEAEEQFQKKIRRHS